MTSKYKLSSIHKSIMSWQMDFLLKHAPRWLKYEYTESNKFLFGDELICNQEKRHRLMEALIDCLATRDNH